MLNPDINSRQIENYVIFYSQFEITIQNYRLNVRTTWEMTYEKFINNILETRGRFNCGEEYHERHHIVPKCMGGTNEEENLIDLFAREHFEAHRMLALENPENEKLVYAWFMMSTTHDSKKRDYMVTSEEYQKSKKMFSKFHSERLKKYWENENNKKKTGLKIKAALSDEKHKKLRSQLSIEYWSSKENRVKASNRNKDFWLSNEEKRQYASECSRKYWDNESNRKNFGDSRKGKNNPMYGKGQTESHIKKRVNKISKPIFCATTNTIYKSGKEASDVTMVNARHICGCCRGERKVAGGYCWYYLYDQNQKDGTIIPGAITLDLITEEEALKMLEEQKDIEGEN